MKALMSHQKGPSIDLQVVVAEETTSSTTGEYFGVSLARTVRSPFRRAR